MQMRFVAVVSKRWMRRIQISLSVRQNPGTDTNVVSSTTSKQSFSETLSLVHANGLEGRGSNHSMNCELEPDRINSPLVPSSVFRQNFHSQPRPDPSLIADIVLNKQRLSGITSVSTLTSLSRESSVQKLHLQSSWSLFDQPSSLSPTTSQLPSTIWACQS